MKTITIKMIISILVLIALGFTSCSEKKSIKKTPTQDEIIKKITEDYLKPKLNDTNSYEFVKIELIDSILYSDNIEYRKKLFNDYIKNDKEKIKREERYRIEFSSIYNDKEIEELKDKIIKNKKILSKIDSLENKLGNKKSKVASYTYYFSFRGKNVFGAKVLNKYILQTTEAPDFEIINMTNNMDEIYFNPNDFPGYREMIEKNL